MPVSRLMLGIALFVTFSMVGVAGIIPPDPDIALDPGAASMPLLVGTNFAENQPTDYYNPFPETITGLIFDLTMNGGLNCSKGVGSLDCGTAGSFHCQSGYFLTCGFTYNSGTGGLAIDFAGTIPSDGDPADTEVMRRKEFRRCFPAACRRRRIRTNRTAPDVRVSVTSISA
jgi:hypothetical protein